MAWLDQLSGIRLAVLVLLLAAALACGPALPPRRSNILLITADTTRQDILGCYGGEAATPALVELARDGILFDNAFAVAFGTTPSHASLLTSLHAAQHGVYNNETILDRRHRTLAEVLHGARYRTAAFVSASPVTGALGFAQGFDSYDDVFVFDRASQLGDFSHHERRADVTADRFIGWLSSSGAAPFFAWIHFYDPHQPYSPKAEPGASRLPEDAYFSQPDGTPLYVKLVELVGENPDLAARVGRRARERYGAEITFLDAQIGRIVERLRALALYDETIVVFVADHGENFLEHGVQMALDHAGLFSSVTRLPLILKLPGSSQAGTNLEFLLGNVDIAPTLLDLVGVDAPAEWTGRSFRSNLYRPEREFRPYLVLEGAERHEISIRTRRWLYREVLVPDNEEALRYLGYSKGSPVELYDVGADRGETRDTAAAAPEIARHFRAIAETFLANREPGAIETLQTKEHLEALRALGYVR